MQQLNRARKPITDALHAAGRTMTGATARAAREEHRLTAAALRDSQDTVQALLDATTETALLIDTEGRIIALNQVACDRLRELSPRPIGRRREELIGEYVFDLFPEELRARRKARNDDVISSGRPARFEDERAGRWMDNSIYPITDADGHVTRLAIFSYDITARKQMEQALDRALQAERERARRDALTGALNHGAIVEELQTLLNRATSGDGHVVAVVDVDGLKLVNDMHGHQTGDAILVAVAESLNVAGAIVGRYGGDEFVAIVPGAGRDLGECYAEAVLWNLRQRAVQDGNTGSLIQARASIGFSTHPGEGSTVAALIELADSRMYAAKRARPVISPHHAA